MDKNNIIIKKIFALAFQNHIGLSILSRKINYNVSK